MLVLVSIRTVTVVSISTFGVGVGVGVEFLYVGCFFCKRDLICFVFVLVGVCAPRFCVLHVGMGHARVRVFIPARTVIRARDRLPSRIRPGRVLR